MKLWSKALSMALSLVLLFLAVPTVVYGEIASAVSSLGDGEESSTSDKNENGTATEISENKAIIYEEESLREESTKHFRLEDGSYLAAQYPSAVHILTEDGTWEDIDNSLSENGSEYANSNARIKFAKKTGGNGNLFTLHDGNTKITMNLVGAVKKTAGKVTNGEDREEDTELQKMLNLEKLSSKIVYEEILAGVDIEYIISGLDVKENIIVKEKRDNYVYTFELKLNGLTASLTEAGDVLITESGETKYIIPAPVVFDKNQSYAEKEDAF